VCGICGVVALEAARPIDPTSLDPMLDSLVHRGPDEDGQVVLGPAGLGIRRLAIVDVEGGQQPLASEDGQVQVVCNGEIYNSPELRSQLIARGHRFATRSDCEVVVHAYEEYGDAFLPRLNGIFGLAVWDHRRRRAVLARDGFGIKPLYYAQHAGHIVFASQPRALLAYPGFPRRLDRRSLELYLSYEYVPTPHSIFDGVRRVKPGHALVVENGALTERAYWQLDLSPDPELAAASEAELAERLWTSLRDVVRLELLSDVPLGVFLSGGIDSSAVAAAMVDLGVDVRTFSIGFPDASFDESGYARRVAAYLGTQHAERVVEPRTALELVPRLAEVLDEPLADASVVPTYLLSRFARERVKVALGGDGGDELFAGYSTLQAHRLADVYQRVPSGLRTGVIEPLVRRLPVSHANMSLDFRAKRFILAADRPLAERHHVWLGAGAAGLLAPDAADGHCPFDVLDEHVSRAAAYDRLSQVLYLDMKMYLEGDILTKVDRASMACSLEVRVPLLNARLVELAAHLPIDLKLRGLTRKYLLRRALAGRLPPEIIRRPKKGFSFPVARWLRADLRPLVLDLLSEDRLRRQGLFDTAQISRLLKDHFEARADNRKVLWTLLIFQLWHARWLSP
jgi:asparagine synthase (glutamine-hydrolysing)